MRASAKIHRSDGVWPCLGSVLIHSGNLGQDDNW